MPSTDDPANAPRVDARRALQARGFAVVRAAAFTDPARAEASPWALVEHLVGQWPVMLERQPIRAVAGGRSFASSNVFTPFHTDSQDFLGAPPNLQILLCNRPAERGGETLLLDTWALLEQIEKRDRALFSAFFTESRHIPFYFGAVDGKTVACKRGHLVFTHSPMAPRDPIGIALAPHLERAHREEVLLRAGDILIVDNHRMLHGRRAFEGTSRDLARILAWLPRPVAEHARYTQLASAQAPPESRSTGAVTMEPRAARIVAEMVAGTPPGVLAAREGVPEALLYRWRNLAFAGAPLHSDHPYRQPRAGSS